MVTDLSLALTAGVGVTAYKKDGSSFTYVPQGSNKNDDANEAMNGNTKYYGGHYFYTMAALTAGMNDDSATVCPRGWIQPYAYRNSKTKSYGGLVEAYGISPETHFNATDLEFQIVSNFPIQLTRNIGRLNRGSFLNTGTTYYWGGPYSGAPYNDYYPQRFIDAQSGWSWVAGCTARCVAS